MSRKGRDSAFDEIGYWSEIKLDIIKEYAAAYSRIMAAQAAPSFSHLYIDGFCGGGFHLSREKGDFVLGSPLNALKVDPPFKEYFLIDLDGGKISELRDIVGDDPRVHLFEGDCNRILVEEVFPRVRYDEFKRALCLLDPYKLDLDWKVIEMAGKSRAIEIFLNFPTMDMNRSVLWGYSEGVSRTNIHRMNRFWGDSTWKSAAYEPTLLEGIETKRDYGQIVNAFRKRLKEKAGFRFVPRPLPMRNQKQSIVYYLFFASPNRVGEKIVEDVFKKYQDRRG